MWFMNDPIQKMMKKMRVTLSKTKFKEAPIVSVAAKCGGSEDLGQWFLNYVILHFNVI